MLERNKTIPARKVMYPKYSKHWPYPVAYTIDCVCSKMLNHGLNHGLFLSLFKLTPCPIHWIVYVLAYLNFIFEFKAVLALPKMVRSAQTHKNISFIWIVWSSLYVNLCQHAKKIYAPQSFSRGYPTLLSTKHWLCSKFYNLIQWATQVALKTNFKLLQTIMTGFLFSYKKIWHFLAKFCPFFVTKVKITQFSIAV